jgi:hypothetical protein
MIGFFKMGNVDKAKKLAVLLDADIGPGVEFDYFDSVGIWTKLAAVSSATTSSSSSSAKPVAKQVAAAPAASSASNKKKKNKAKSSVDSPAPISSSSSTVPAPSPMNANSDSSVQYEPDTKPAQKKNVSSSLPASPPPLAPAAAAALPLPHVVGAGSLPTMGLDPIGYTQKTQARVVYAACPICFDHFPDCTIVPCGHTFCVDCIKKLKICSICREPAAHWMRLHLSQGEADTD